MTLPPGGVGSSPHSSVASGLVNFMDTHDGSCAETAGKLANRVGTVIESQFLSTLSLLLSKNIEQEYLG